jgi:hypothetical protein
MGGLERLSSTSYRYSKSFVPCRPFLYVYMYIYLPFMYLYISIYYIQTDIYSYIYIHIYICSSIFNFVSLFRVFRPLSSVSISVYMYIYIHICICINIKYTHINRSVFIYIHSTSIFNMVSLFKVFRPLSSISVHI